MEPERVNCKIRTRRPEDEVKPISPAELSSMYINGQISLAIYTVIMNAAKQQVIIER